MENDIKSAFDANGVFTSDNWNCPIITRILKLYEKDNKDKTLYGEDQTCHVIHCYSEHAWVVLARYKSRGRTSNAFVFNEDGNRPLTKEVAENLITELER